MKALELKKIREKMGLTQKELALAIDVTQPDISEWENDISPISKFGSLALKMFVALKFNNFEKETKNEKIS